MNKRQVTVIAVALLLALSLQIPLSSASGVNETDDQVTDLGTDHYLDSSDGVSEFNNDGFVEAETDRIQMTVSIAESSSDVGLGDRILPSSVRNDFVRLQYHEEADRTVRILIPSDYWTPYPREGLESATGSTTADLKPVRGGDYTEILVRFDGPDDVILPIQWDASVSYQAIERIDDRLQNSFGINLRDDESEWTYIEGDEVTDGPGYSIGEPAGDVTVQYDATPDSPQETWINAPRGETMSDDIYYYQRDSEDGTAYIVSKTDEPPAIRYNVDSSFTDRLRGDIRELRQIPNRIGEIVGF